MVKFLQVFALLLCLLPASLATAEEVAQPDDQYKPYLTVFVAAGTSEAKQLDAWFSTDPELRKIRDVCHYQVIDTRSPMYRERYAKTCPVTPMIRLQTSSDGVLLELKGMPKAAYVIVRAVKHKLMWLLTGKRKGDQCPGGRCHPKKDQPDEDTARQDPPAQPLDPPQDAIAPEEQSFPWLALVCLCITGSVVSGGLGLAYQYRETYRS